MRAQFVYEKLQFLNENLAFERGRDPKESIGIGIDPSREESFIPFIIDNIPQILGTEEIPEDILIDPEKWINRDYSEVIRSFIKNFMYKKGYRVQYPEDNFHDVSHYLGYNVWKELSLALQDMGFEED